MAETTYPTLHIRIPFSEGGDDFIARLKRAAESEDRKHTPWAFLAIKRALLKYEAENLPAPKVALAPKKTGAIIASHTSRGRAHDLTGDKRARHHASSRSARTVAA